MKNSAMLRVALQGNPLISKFQNYSHFRKTETMIICCNFIQKKTVNNVERTRGQLNLLYQGELQMSFVFVLKIGLT